ncbi:MAG: hypothetical protein AAFQ35_13570 [Pseudomonadota bacterium]
MDFWTLSTLMIAGIVVTNLAAITFALITQRAPVLAFEEGDSKAIALALAFRMVAAPGILVYSFWQSALKGGTGDQAVVALATGLLWGAIYGVGLGAVV